MPGDAAQVVRFGGIRRYRPIPARRRAVVGGPGDDHLALGQCMGVGEAAQLWNKIHDTRFILQTDGNLVAYTGQAVWASGTVGRPAARLCLQPDGDLQIVDARNAVLWSNGMGAKGGAVVVVQDDGNVVEYTADGRPIWATNSQKNNGPFAGLLGGIQQIAGYLQTAGAVFGIPMTNINLAFATGQNPLDAIKADVATFAKDGQLAKAVTSGDYMQAWGIATQNGKLFDPSLPTPPGQSYANGAVVPVSAVQPTPATLPGAAATLAPGAPLTPAQQAAVVALQQWAAPAAPLPAPPPPAVPAVGPAAPGADVQPWGAGSPRVQWSPGQPLVIRF